MSPYDEQLPEQSYASRIRRPTLAAPSAGGIQRPPVMSLRRPTLGADKPPVVDQFVAGGGTPAPAAAEVNSITRPAAALYDSVATAVDRSGSAAREVGDRLSGRYAPSFSDQMRFQISGERPPAGTPKVNIINPRNPASMAMRPPAPASVAPQAPAPAKVTAGARIQRPVTYNDGTGATYRTGDGRTASLPPGVAVTYDKRGNPAFGATGDSVAQASSVPSLPTVSVSPGIQRPGSVIGSAQSDRSIIRNPDEDRRRLEIALSGATFSPARSRGARSAQAQMVNGLLAQDQQRRQLEAQDANAVFDANTRIALANSNEQNANYRAELGDAGETQRARLMIERPTYTTDAQGNYLSVQGSRASPVTNAAGSTIQMPRPETSLTAKDILDSYDRQLASAPIGVDAAQWQAQVDGSPLGIARAAMLARQWPLPPKVGTEKGGHKYTGGDPSDEKNWEAIK